MKEIQENNIEDIIIVEGIGGESINEFAKKLIKTAYREKKNVEGTFNGITLKVPPPVTEKDIVDFYDNEWKREAEEYKNSDEYKKTEKEHNKIIQLLQEKTNELIDKLDSLDFNNLDLILGWLSKIAEINSNVSVSVDSQKIIKAFNSNGFNSNLRTEIKNIDKDTAEYYAKLIIAFALESLESNNRIPFLISTSVKKYKKNFNK